MPRSKSKLTELELACVANYKGNQIEAAKAAGVKNAKKQASAIFNRPRVRAAIEKKISALIAQTGKDLGKAITVTRNDIINRLDQLSQHAETDSAKISACAELVKVFGLSARDGKGDLFAGWSDEELSAYARTGELPARYRSQLGTSEGDGSASSTPASATNRTKRS